MGKSAPKQAAPVVVNAGQSATEQAAFNKDSALQQRALNMVDQHTPEGSVTYSATGTEIEGIPQYQVERKFSPEQQNLYDLSTQLSQKYGETGNRQLDAVRQSLETPFNVDSLGAAPTLNEDTRTATRDAMIARMQPNMDRDKAALETALANQGFARGTEGFDDAMDESNRTRTDAYLAADIQAGNEMGRMYGMETDARDRSINEILMQRNQPLAEMATFMSGTQPNAPSFLPSPQSQVAAPDFMGAQFANANMLNAANQNSFNQQSAGYRGNVAGLAGLGGAGLQAAGWNWGR